MTSIQNPYSIEVVQKMWNEVVSPKIKVDIPNGEAVITAAVAGLEKYFISYQGNVTEKDVTSPFTPDMESIKNFQESLAKEKITAVGVSLCASLFTLLLEAAKLQKIWNDICATDILEQCGLEEEKGFFQENIDKLPALFVKLAEEVHPACYETLDKAKQLQLHIKKSKERDDIRKLLDRIEKDIDNIEIEIDEKSETLSDICEAIPLPVRAQFIMEGEVARNAKQFASGTDIYLVLANIVAYTGHLWAGLKQAEKADETKAMHVTLGEKLVVMKWLRDLTFQQQINLDEIFNEQN